MRALKYPKNSQHLIKAIKDDLGALPDAYVQAAAGQAGRGVNRQQVDESRRNNRQFCPRLTFTLTMNGITGGPAIGLPGVL